MPRPTDNQEEQDARQEESLSADEARQVLVAEQQRRSDQCRQAITAVLEQHRCMIVPRMIIRGNNIASDIEIILSE